MNPHGPVGILWGFLNGCEIKRKSHSRLSMFELRRIESNFEFVLMAVLNFSYIIITEYT